MTGSLGTKKGLGSTGVLTHPFTETSDKQSLSLLICQMEQRPSLST